MKKILAVCFMLFAGFVFAQVAIVKDKADMFDCPDTKAYIAACKDAQGLKSVGEYEKAATATPFSWCAAWYLYNAAGQVMSDKSESGEWNFCNPEATAETKIKANEYLKASLAMAEASMDSKFHFPKSGKNGKEAFDYAWNNANDALNGTRCEDAAKETK